MIRENKGNLWTYFFEKKPSYFSLVSANFDADGFFSAVFKNFGRLFFVKLTQGSIYTSNNNLTHFQIKYNDGFWIMKNQGNLNQL